MIQNIKHGWMFNYCLSKYFFWLATVYFFVLLVCEEDLRFASVLRDFMCRPTIGFLKSNHSRKDCSIIKYLIQNNRCGNEEIIFLQHQKLKSKLCCHSLTNRLQSKCFSF